MELTGKRVVVTGGGSGIGAAFARQVAAAGAQVVVGDLNEAAAQTVATEIGGLGLACDVGSEAGVQDLIAQAGEIDIFVSNAGLGGGEPDHVASASDEIWDLNWRVHVMAHVWAARALLPGMVARGSGYFVNVASAAGLLNQVGDAAYSATKHAAVSFAESLAITHGEDGIGVSVVCPQYVATPLIGLSDADAGARETLLTADEVAAVILDGIRDARFLILPHADVATYTALRAQDHDRWIGGMRKLRALAKGQLGKVDPAQMYRLV